jgi:hypothetical protein
MSQLPLSLSASLKQKIKSASRSKKLMTKELQFHGYNKDIVEAYYWNINFGLYRGKGYVPIKIEDHHYFSETSQFGSQFRQLKGGSIRAFQENLQQLISLVKVHLMPLLKEVKKADELKGWMDSIVENDVKYQQGLEKNLPKNHPDMIKWSRARDEAINHLKDRWVNEVDGGRIWQMARSQAEGGLDMVLLPQLFFGTKLDNPLYMLHGKGKDLATQLDEYTYQIDVTSDALQAVARFQYKFYQWLPTAIKETESTFKIKIASLKQFYSQLQMYVQFMKPLLVEIAKKSEGFEKTNMYYEFSENNPDYWNMLDSSYSFVRILGVNKLLKERGGEGLDILKFTPYGYYLAGRYLKWGSYKGKSGIITEEINKGSKDEPIYVYKYKLCPHLSREEAIELSQEEFDKLEEVEIYKQDVELLPCIEYEFNQQRRNEIKQTPQGPQHVPFMKNTLRYHAYAWNPFEIAAYKEYLKKDELELLEHFIGEVAVMKEDLLYYVGLLEKKEKYDTSRYEEKEEKKQPSQKTSSNKQQSELNTLITGPFKALLSPFTTSLTNTSSSTHSPSTKAPKMSEEQKNKIDEAKSGASEDAWKIYSIFKKAHGFIQY